MAFSDYIVFADESGDHGLDQIAAGYPVFVLAFALVRKADYVDSIVPSIQRLKLDYFGHDQIVFHEREIRKQLPPFGFLRADPVAREEFLARINGIVGQAQMRLIASVIHKDKLKQRYVTPFSPYELGLMFCMEQLHAKLLSKGQEGMRVHVIFESRGRPEDDALELEFRRIVTNEKRFGWRAKDFTRFEWVAVFVPKSSNSSGLQLADLAARPIGLHCLRPDQANRAYEILRPKVWALKEFP